MIMWKLLLFLCLVGRARADGWDDFTNNLASDLAPLLALFGESVTKQFLSESISSLDNVNFAVLPLGIITAIVSVIRVLGSVPLRRKPLGRNNTVPIRSRCPQGLSFRLKLQLIEVVEAV
jgi:hypothetical protein